MLQANDDLDDLFRKAAENYPLKTDNADWERVRPFLSLLSPEEVTAGTSSPKKNYRKLLWLLLLLPILWAGYKVIFKSDQPINEQVLLNHKSSTESLSNFPKQAKPDDNNAKSNVLNSVKVNQPESYAVKESAFNKYERIHKNKWSSQSNTKASVINSDEVSLGENNDALNNSTIEKRNDFDTDVKNKEIKVDQHDSSIPEKTLNPQEDKVDQRDTLIPEKTLKPQEKQVNTIASLKTKSSQSKGISKGKQTHGLYAGLVVGTDYSTVKFQATKKIGFNLGMIAGYQFNKVFSIESGLTWDKKFYYSTGQYFNTKKINVPPSEKIKDVSGNCQMLEVPVNLKLNLVSSAKTNLFFITGLSSYFMKIEDYNYTITNPGWGSYSYSKKYKESSSFLFSVVNMGVGYSHAIGKGETLRIAPYAKVPLSGVGIGKLPITSLGINLGLTKKIFNR